MEIYSLRSLGSLLYKNEGKNQREQTSGAPSSSMLRSSSFVEQIEEVASAYHSVSPRQLRERAQQAYENGVIDQDTYRQLASELPMHAIDQQGRIVDLSAVADDTPFNFHEYYKNQLEIALNVGDSQNAAVLRGALDFLEP